MGERKGVNKYYPPDYDPSRGGLNKWQGTHALRERARKIHLGIIIIRFEMPYNIWCEGCGNHIGMGVRYNAEKTKVGMYYTTPVYQFRMKCHLCNNHFEIKTDPANFDYEIVSGARRQERRFDQAENGTVVADTRAVIDRLHSDGMFRLDHEQQDDRKMALAEDRLLAVQQCQERLQGEGQYTCNRQLRDTFRQEKRKIEQQKKSDAKILKRNSIDIQLLPEHESDSKVAKLSFFCDPIGCEKRSRLKRNHILSQSVFGADKHSGSTTSACSTSVRPVDFATPSGGSSASMSLSAAAASVVSRDRLGVRVGERRQDSEPIDTRQRSSQDPYNVSCCLVESEKHPDDTQDDCSSESDMIGPNDYKSCVDEEDTSNGYNDRISRDNHGSDDSFDDNGDVLCNFSSNDSCSDPCSNVVCIPDADSSHLAKVVDQNDVMRNSVFQLLSGYGDFSNSTDDEP